MDEISPALHRLKGSAVYMPGQTHFSGKVIFAINNFAFNNHYSFSVSWVKTLTKLDA